jgi:hypothetical protein
LSDLAHFAVFWMSGLLTGTLLGWMLCLGKVTETPQSASDRQPGEGPRRAA